MKIEVDVLGSPSLIVLMVSMDVKQHWIWTCWKDLPEHLSLPLMYDQAGTSGERDFMGKEMILELWEEIGGQKSGVVASAVLIG